MTEKLEGQIDEKSIVIYEENSERRRSRTAEAIAAGIPLIVVSGSSCCGPHEKEISKALELLPRSPVELFYLNQCMHSIHFKLGKPLSNVMGTPIYFPNTFTHFHKQFTSAFPGVKTVDQYAEMFKTISSFEELKRVLLTDQTSMADLAKTSMSGLREKLPKLVEAYKVGNGSADLEEMASSVQELIIAERNLAQHDSTPGKVMRAILTKYEINS